MQDFTNLELIIVDDGSTDNTEEAIREFQRRDDRVRYFKLPKNKRIGFARYYGSEQVRGKYIACIDSDDQWFSAKLSKQVRVLDTFPEIEILFSDFISINEGTSTISSGFAPATIALEMLETEQLDDNLWRVTSGMEYALLRKMMIQLGTVVFRANILQRSGGINPDLSGPEDQEFCWRAAIMGCCFAYTTEMTQTRYINETSVTARKTNSIYQTLRALDICYQTGVLRHRWDVLKPIKNAKLRNWRNLIWLYGRENLRKEACKAYLESLRTGFSVHNLAFWIIAMAGSKAVDLAQAGLCLR